MKTILEMIEQAEAMHGKRPAITDPTDRLSYCELLANARRIGSGICDRMCGQIRRPIAIYMDKTPALAAAMLGILYSGCFYVVLDSQMPIPRVKRIFETLHPSAVLTDEAHREVGTALCAEENAELLLYETLMKHSMDEQALQTIRMAVNSSDLAYILYTSGSTGQPKGVVITHGALMSYIQWFIGAFHIDEKVIFGSQTPFYFSMSVSDLYGALCTGAELVILPREMFSFPLTLVEFMNQKKVNTIYWVPSALSLIANWDTFAYQKFEDLDTILFAGEVMPNKQLNYWRRYYPEARFANLFGPTETTDICTWYAVDRPFEDHETLPIGVACDNCDVFIVDEQGQEAESGELLVRGPFLARGYYNNPEKTLAAFVQNPLNRSYPEIVYRTGDLVTRNSYGELIYLGRKDFQIKHMGYRIELGEIEAAIGAIEKILACVCIYDDEQDQIIAVYEGRVKTEVLVEAAAARLPYYMRPNRFVRVKKMPYNANGKIDRSWLKKNYNQI